MTEVLFEKMSGILGGEESENGRSLAYVWGLGSTCLTAAIILPHPRDSYEGGLIAVAVIGYLFAALMFVWAATIPRRLLIVEDHVVNQEVARGIATKLGYRSDVASNGIEALEALARRDYDAVLMDCHMPVMDGVQATIEILRREAGRSHVPIIAMTAGAMVEDRERCLAAGMDDFMSKPIKNRELKGVLNRRLGGSQAAQHLETIDGGPDSGSGSCVDRYDEDDDEDDDEDEDDSALDAAQFDTLRRLAERSPEPDVLRGLVDLYLEQAGSQLAELRKAAYRGDAPGLRSVAHALRGCSATMGARLVASASGAIEEAAARGDMPGGAAVDRVAIELGRATAELEAAAMPMRRVGHPDEVAAAAVFLGSDDAAFIAARPS